MTLPSTRHRSNSSPASIYRTQPRTNLRIAEFILNDVNRHTRKLKVDNSSPRILTRGKAPSNNDGMCPVKNNPNTKSDLPHTAPVVKKAFAKPKKMPPMPPMGIDPKVIRRALDRSIQSILTKDRNAHSYNYQLFESFSGIVDKCLAGHQDLGVQEYSVFFAAATALSPYLMPEEEAMLDKLEKLSFVS